VRKLICWLTGHKWLKPYHKTDYPEFICRRCGEYGSTGVKPPKDWPRMPETKAPERPDRAPVAEWLDPLIYPPPRGMKIQLLTDWEIAVYGHWSDTGYVAWAPLMTKPAWLVQRLRDKALSRRGESNARTR
jgi:hypothetical protein